MTITQDEIQLIVSRVLTAIRTNSSTINQLTPVTELDGTDSFEISGGKRITYATLNSLITSPLIANNEEKIGNPNGLAPLGADAKVPETYLRDSVFGVQDFGGVVDNVTAQDYIADKGYKYVGCTVVFDTTANRFRLKVVDGDTTTYYRNWENSGRHGILVDGDIVPYTNKIYINPSGGGTAYLWTGSKFALFTIDLANSSIFKRKADLDSSNLIPTAQIPGDALDVVAFDGIISVAPADILWSTPATSRTEGAKVYFNTSNNVAYRRFLLNIGSNFYAHWGDSDRFGIAGSAGAKPYPNKTYCHLFVGFDSNGDAYLERAYSRWSGNNLIPNIPYNPAIVTYAYGININNSDGSANPAYHIVTGAYRSPSATDPDSVVVYVSERKRFMLRTPGATPGVTNLYPTFSEQAEYGTADDLGIIPHPFKTFRNEAGGTFQQWDGEALTTPTSAYAVRNELSSVVNTFVSSLNALRVSVDALNEEVDPLPGEISAAAIKTFDDLWIKAGLIGSTGYSSIDRENHPNSPYILNDVPLTYNEALTVYSLRWDIVTCLSSGASCSRRPIPKVKTLFPFYSAVAVPKLDFLFKGLFWDFNTPLVLAVASPSGNDHHGLKVSTMRDAFYGCRTLTKIIGKIDVSAVTDFTSTFGLCSALVDIDLYGLKANLNISVCSNISLNSLSLIVNQALNTSSITITVHKDVYDKLTGSTQVANSSDWESLLETAVAKNIQFAKIN